MTPSGREPPASDGPDPVPEASRLRQRLDEAGYTVIGTHASERGTVWRLAPHRSQVEFELVGDDELRRFLRASGAAPRGPGDRPDHP